MPALLVTITIMHVALSSLTVEANKIDHVLVADFRMLEYVLMTLTAGKAIIVLLQAVTLFMKTVRRSLTTPVRTRL